MAIPDAPNVDITAAVIATYGRDTKGDVRRIDSPSSSSGAMSINAVTN